ncbi:hypothetical protein ACFQ6S_32815 [Streptomyces sp. NPDC056479]|uniref:hypothetical protein n=1 Tax=Streptomyces sp. NPDC056479 TaxID=3345832 RepID=UPI003685B1EA
MRKLLTTAGLAASALATGVLLATPAAAASADSDFEVYFPGNKPETLYNVTNTADAASGKITAKSVVSWQILVDQVVDNSKRFTSFKITTRLESRPGKDSADVVETSRTCDLTKIVNDEYSWFLIEPVNTCVAPSMTYDGEVWWSSDSTIVYDIEGDGKGAVTKQLQGSPLVHG